MFYDLQFTDQLQYGGCMSRLRRCSATQDLRSQATLPRQSGKQLQLEGTRDP